MIAEPSSNIIRVNIRNTQDPKAPLVDPTGKILKYLIQNIRGFQYVNMDDVEFQIKEALKRQVNMI